MIKQKLKLLGFCILLTCVVLSSSGCMGLLTRKMMIGNEGKYSELSNALAPIKEGKGRVFIYMTDGGATIINTFGLIAEPLSIDNIMHFISGRTFFYVDLDVGEHKLTSSKMIKGAFKKTIYEGENVLDFELLNQEIKYIRIDFKGTNRGFGKFASTNPFLVELDDDVKSKLNNLKFYADYSHGMWADKIWKVGDTFM